MKRIAWITLGLFVSLWFCGAYAAEVTVFGPKQYVRSSGPPDVSSDSFTSPPGQAKILVKNGHAESSHGSRVSSAVVRLNGQTIFGPSDFNPHADLLEAQVDLASVNTVSVELRSKPGSFLTVEIIEQIDPPSVSIEASPLSIEIGASATLSWNSANAHTCVIEPDIGTVDVNGSMAVSPTATTTYTITATGMGGTGSASATVTVSYPPPIVNLNASPEEIQQGESATLTWSTTYADSCTIEPELGNVEPNGSVTVSPSETTTYMITASGPGGATQAFVTIAVSSLPMAPVVEFAATPWVVLQGQSTTLSWNSTRAQSAHIDNGIGSVPVAGSATVSPSHTTTYTITVTGPAGSGSALAQVTVTGNPEPPAEGSFAETYQNLIPADATIESYDSRRFSVITGLVYGVDECPMADVSVTIHGHPEYGTAFTDADGRFSIPMDGGATFTIAYNKDGWLTSHRKVYVPWNDIAIAEKIVMIAQDPVSTTIAFDGDPATVVTHQSSMLTDEFGSRSCSMVFTGNNRAYLTDENGNDVYELTTITARATAYATLESMPAVLPPNSGFTYCVELAVDGAQRVRFARPVVVWVDNYLGFDVGEIVPVGYYDRDRGVWVPSDNGKVVRLLDTDSDGIVDSLDADGNGLPDDLNGDGFFADEVYGLSDPERYAPGATFWRVAVTHFTPEDFNWPFGPPLDAISPNPQGVPDANQPTHEQPKAPPEDTKCLNSYVKQRNRVFHEDIPIPGTDITLHYASSRTSGYKTVISVPASGESVPASLEEIIVKVEVAGRTLEERLAPLPDQMAELVWDGMDHLGNQVQGSASANISVGFVYEGVYYRARQDFVQAFAQAGSGVTAIRAQQKVISWKNSGIRLSQETSTISEGWTLSQHHLLDSVYATLHKGAGGIIKNNTSIIDTVAGTGEWGYNGDGGPATQAWLHDPLGVTVDVAGNFYIAEFEANRIRKVNAAGIISTVAGTGEFGYSGDGGPATQATLSYPSTIAMDAVGNLFIADCYNHRIRKVDASGIIITVVGTGEVGYSGDRGPATQARLCFPEGVAVDASGMIYIADSNRRIRKVDTGGIITTVAGTGEWGYRGYGDGGPAIKARFSFLSGVAVDAAGNIYIADSSDSRIRKVDTAGIITTVAGGGRNNYLGDGGPAIEAWLRSPHCVSVDAAGNLYIAETDNSRIRKVNASGIITTVAGGQWGSSGDGEPATQAGLRWPEGVAIDTTGNLYIADNRNNRIRKVSPPSLLAKTVADGEFLFAEENGQGHVISASGLHLKTIDLNTGMVIREFFYNQENKLASISDQFESEVLIERDGSGAPSAIVSPDGLTTIFTIDAENHLTRITFPDGSHYDFQYSPDGLLTVKIDPNGNRFENVFDSMGRLSTISDEEGGLWQYSRMYETDGDIVVENLSAEGNLTTFREHTDSTGAYTSIVTDPTGAETIHSRSADGLTVQESLSCGMNLSFQYNIDSLYKYPYVKQMTEKTPSGLQRIRLRQKTYENTTADEIPDLITETVTVNGKAGVFKQDILQSQKTVISPEARSITSFYDPVTLVTQRVSIPGLFDTTYGYDIKGRLGSINTNTRETTFAYNSQGFLDSVTDSVGYTTSFAYDAIGRPQAVYRPDGSSVGFSYDQNGNQTAVITPGGVGHSFGYSRVNRNTSYLTPISGRYEYLYDRDRRLIQTKFPSGFQIDNIYDKTRLMQIRTPEGNIDFTFLCGTKVGSITNGANSIGYGYDGRLVTSEILSGTLNQSLSYTYNNDFNLESFTYAGQTTNYTYDNDGLLTGSGPFAVGRNAGNGFPETVNDGVFSLSRTFNGYGEVETQSHAAGGLNVASWSLGRDRTGRITAKTETMNRVEKNLGYTYDAAGRLETVTKDGDLVEEYAYDISGTRIFERNELRGIAGRSYAYSAEDHLLSAGDVTYQYDVDGFLTAKTKETEVTAYNYSSRGELLNVSLPDGRIIEYIHDPFGRRIAKRVNGVTVEKYLWSGLSKLLAVYDGSGPLKMRFEYADGRMPVVVTIAGVMYYLAYDQVGSMRVVVGGDGNLVKEVQYDSFGNVIFDSNPAFEIPFGFAGGLYDKDTGLVRFGYRDYDPDTGRWTAKDPIFFAGGDSDFYGYVLNNPVNFIDPWGLITSEEIGNIIFNETRSLNGPDIYQARLNIAHSMRNADHKWGDDRNKHAGTAPTTVNCVPESERNTYMQSQIAAIVAFHQQGAGIDPTNGATNFNFRNSNSTSSFQGMPLQTQVGPLNNSYPTTTLNATGIYSNTYGK